MSVATILLVDDDTGYRDSLDRYLGTVGFTPFSVSTGDQALASLKNIRPNLILLDWVLKEGIRATELLRILKARPETRTIPVVVISGLRETPEDELQARQLGAADFLTKDEISHSMSDQSFLRRLRALILQGGVEEAKRHMVEERRPAQPPARRLLVIEDDPEMRAFLSQVLTEKGYTVVAVESGAAGLTHALQEPPDLVLLDLTLPDIDGLEVCSRLKSLTATREVPVVFLTGHSSKQARLLATEYGADHFFTKPLADLDEFHEWIGSYLRRRTRFSEESDVLRVGGMEIDLRTRTVAIDGRRVERIPQVPFRLLCEFARNPTAVLSRAHLVRTVWKNKAQDHNVDTNVFRLRKRLGVGDDWFFCVSGEGFRMLPPAQGRADGSQN